MSSASPSSQRIPRSSRSAGFPQTLAEGVGHGEALAQSVHRAEVGLPLARGGGDASPQNAPRVTVIGTLVGVGHASASLHHAHLRRGLPGPLRDVGNGTRQRHRLAHPTHSPASWLARCGTTRAPQFPHTPDGPSAGGESEVGRQARPIFIAPHLGWPSWRPSASAVHRARTPSGHGNAGGAAPSVSAVRRTRHGEWSRVPATLCGPH